MTKLQHLGPLLLRASRRSVRGFASSKDEPPDDGEDPSRRKANRPTYVPEAPSSADNITEPTTCCMSGCANCVWIEYAEKLSVALKGSPADVQKAIMDKVQDPNMRAFLAMELRVRKLID